MDKEGQRLTNCSPLNLIIRKKHSVRLHGGKGGDRERDSIQMWERKGGNKEKERETKGEREETDSERESVTVLVD